MSESPRTSTLPCHVRLRLTDGKEIEGTVWLLADPSRESGFTPLEVILQDSKDFLFVGLDRGGNMLVARRQIRYAEIPADSPGAPADLPGGASLDVLTLHLDSGEEITGVLRSVAPQGFERMSDVMNAQGPFISLGTGDKLVLVAKPRVVRVSF